MELVYLFIGLILGGLAVWMVMRSKMGAVQQLLDVTKQQQEEQKQQHEALQEEQKKARQEERQQQEEQMRQQLALIREQMNSASEKILKERAEQLSAVNKEQLSGILTPLQTHIQQMREAVERSDREHNSTMQRLDATIKTSIEQSRQVGERADKLAQALTGENKTQGNFGELRLKQLLEGMGLQEGEQFTLQERLVDIVVFFVFFL